MSVPAFRAVTSRPKCPPFECSEGAVYRAGGGAVREDQERFLARLGQLPARLTVEETAWVLGCQAHDVPILVSARLLKPLGNPAPNGVKYFFTADILELTKDRGWLAKMTNTVCLHWQTKNARKGRGAAGSDQHDLLDAARAERTAGNAAAA